MRCTLLPDANVIVAASICDVSVVFGTVVAEPHHEESRRLLDAPLDAGNCCRCVVSPTVAGEVRRPARRAATHAVHKAIGVQRVKKSKTEFEEIDRIIVRCVDQSSRFVSPMDLHDPHRSLVEAHLAEVDKMAAEIKKGHAKILAEQAARRGAGVSSRSDGAVCSGGGRAVAWPELSNLAQYERFLKREPMGNAMDKRILAVPRPFAALSMTSQKYSASRQTTWGYLPPSVYATGECLARSWT